MTTCQRAWIGWMVGVLAGVGCSSGRAFREVEPPATVMPAAMEGELAADAFLGGPLVSMVREAEGEAEAPAARTEVLAVESRQVIYSATLRLVVVSTREAQASVRAIAAEAGGHLQESDAHSITIRVPAQRFEAVLTQLAHLGELVDQAIRAQDITEEMLDLGIRIENARKARERLLEHLAKSDKMEDTLRIEAELTRVTEELERLEGRKRYLESQVAMSTIRVELNASERGRGEEGLELPFEWIARLGDGLVAGTVQSLPRKPQFLSRGPRFEPPHGFVRYYSNRRLVEAMDADGLRLKVQWHDNFDEGALSFWSQLTRKALVERRALAVTEARDLGADRAALFGTREVGREKQAYLLVIVRHKKDLYTFEAWGPEELFDAQREALIESAASLVR